MKINYTKIKNAMFAALLAVNVALTGAMAAEVDTSFLTEDPETDYFAPLRNFLEGLGASGYKLLRSGVVIFLVFSIIGCAISISSSQAAKRAEGKAHLGWVIFSGILVFASVAVLGLIISIGGQITFTEPAQ